MTLNVLAFDNWIRNGFVEINTELEGLYSAQDDRALVAGVGDQLKSQLVEEGREFIIRLLNEGSTLR